MSLSDNLRRLARERVPTGAGEVGSVLALLQCIPAIQSPIMFSAVSQATRSVIRAQS